jgi:hypothetical protein
VADSNAVADNELVVDGGSVADSNSVADDELVVDGGSGADSKAVAAGNPVADSELVVDDESVVDSKAIIDDELVGSKAGIALAGLIAAERANGSPLWSQHRMSYYKTQLLTDKKHNRAESKSIHGFKHKIERKRV